MVSMISRRGFLAGILAAPAIVHIASIMPVKVLPAEMLKPRLHRPWRAVDITRAEAIAIFVDGLPVDPSVIIRDDWSRSLHLPQHRLRMPVPPPGSHQFMMLREYA